MRIAIIMIGVIGLVIVTMNTNTYMPEISQTDINERLIPDAPRKVANQTAPELRYDTPRCQMCKHNDEVIPIIYGRPSPELLRKAEAGEVKIAGCTIPDNAPHWYCKKHEEDLQNS